MQPALPLSTAPRFDGRDLTAGDQRRLAAHLQKVLDLMRDGQWRTLEEIAHVVGCTVQGASARLRDLRKHRHGGWTVERTRIEDGLFVYRVTA